MKRFIIGFGWLVAACLAVAGTGKSNEFRVDTCEGKEVPVGELIVEWETDSFMYDSNGKTPGVTAKNGDRVLEKGVDYTVHYDGDTNAGTAKSILRGCRRMSDR